MSVTVMLRSAFFVLVIVAVVSVQPVPANPADGGNAVTLLGGEVPTEWNEVASTPEKVKILRLLVAQAQGNYERIRTWKGVYFGHVKTLYSADSAASALEAPLERKVESPHIQDVRFELEFAIDSTSDVIYRWFRPTKLSWFDADTGAEVHAPNVEVPNEASIVTPEHYLHTTPGHVYQSFMPVADFPRAQNKRAVFRDPASDARGQEFATLIDPRKLFGQYPGFKSWEGLKKYVEALEGKEGAQKQAEVDRRCRIFRASDEQGTWYRRVVELTAPDGSTQISDGVWSSKAGFHQVNQAIFNGALEGELLTRSIWHYTKVNGVYVPSYRSFATYRDRGVVFDRELELEECSVNEPVPASQFTYSALGLRDGDLIMDRTENVCYILEEGEPVQLAAFGERYVPPGDARWQRPSVRAIFLAGNVVLIVAFLLLIWRRRARSAAA